MSSEEYHNAEKRPDRNDDDSHRKALQDKLDELARQSNRSRNEIVNMALEYALKM